MEKNEIENKVLQLVREVSGQMDCELEMDLVDEIGLSSVEVMELISGTERLFGIKIASRELRLVMTPADLAALAAQKMQA